MSGKRRNETRDLYKAVCNLVGLTGAQRVGTLQSGQSRAENRIGWATNPYKAELIEKPARGAYALTVGGQQFRLETQPPSPRTTKPSIPEDSAADPLESIENGIATLTAK
jgi:restriction system protein